MKILTPIERHNNSIVKYYDYILKDSQNEPSLIFMNHGFSPCMITLDKCDIKWKHQISLYNHLLLEAFDLGLDKIFTTKRILEIGSGRGGGLSFIKKYYNPLQATGVDINKNQVSFCNKTHAIEGLDYVEGDACSLNIENDSIDIIINVESSHCYSNITSFYQQVSNKLKKGGFFLYTDIFFPDEQLYKDFLNFDKSLLPDIDILLAKDITKNVIDACKIDKKDFMTTLPEAIASLMSEIASEKLNKYENNQIRYLSVIGIKR